MWVLKILFCFDCFRHYFYRTLIQKSTKNFIFTYTFNVQTMFKCKPAFSVDIWKVIWTVELSLNHYIIYYVEDGLASWAIVMNEFKFVCRNNDLDYFIFYYCTICKINNYLRSKSPMIMLGFYFFLWEDFERHPVTNITIE